MSDDQWVSVEPYNGQPEHNRVCGSPKGRMSPNGGTCTAQASYTVTDTATGRYVTCCGMHLRAEIDFMLRSKQRHSDANTDD